VNLELRNADSSTGSPNRQGYLDALYKIPGPPRTESFTIPELKMTVRQRLILEEKTVKLIVPVVQSEWKPRSRGLSLPGHNRKQAGRA
jgi:hypothetical protein